MALRVHIPSYTSGNYKLQCFPIIFLKLFKKCFVPLAKRELWVRVNHWGNGSNWACAFLRVTVLLLIMLLAHGLHHSSVLWTDKWLQNGQQLLAGCLEQCRRQVPRGSSQLHSIFQLWWQQWDSSVSIIWRASEVSETLSGVHKF